MRPFRTIAPALLLGLFLPAAALCVTDDDLKPLVEQQNIEGIKLYGEPAMENLVRLYADGNETERTRIAAILYGLGWKSDAAKLALMKDLHTSNEALRLQVQWALGKVSNDDEVVTELLKNMRDDPNPLFRDKAACALANDQVHLTEKQKIRLYEGVIAAMDDEKLDVRRIAAQVMAIQTGQRKNYNPEGSSEERKAGIASWRSWLAEYAKAVADE